MWLFTEFGFFSIVQKPGDEVLTVRARVAADLDQLRDNYMPQLTATKANAGSDYEFRATISHNNFAVGLAAIGQDIHYSNFKSAVSAKRDGRSTVYHQVWSTLFDLNRKVFDGVRRYAGLFD